jgi:NADH-quinone oxidoreductase subunit J
MDLAIAAGKAASGAARAEFVVFFFIAPLAVLSALLMVFARHAVRAALLLVINLFCLAVFYVVLEAHFLAAVQVVVYAGAIMVLFLFVIMLLGVDREESLKEKIRAQRPIAILFALALTAGLYVAVRTGVMHSLQAVGLTQANASGNVEGLAETLFTSYVLPFEVTSLLLVVAAVGALVLGRRK